MPNTAATEGRFYESALRFRLFGFPTRVRASFLFVWLIMLSGQTTFDPIYSLAVGPIVFVSILVHELGHALAARAFGLKASMELYGMGGLTHHDAPPENAYGKTLVISIAGPLAGVLLGGIVVAFVLALGSGTGTVSSLVRVTLYVNLGWSVINLLPILPYDGGNALRAILNIVTRGRGNLPTHIVSIIVGTAACVVALIYRMPFGAYLAGMAVLTAIGGLRHIRLERTLDRAWVRYLKGDPQGASADLERLVDSGAGHRIAESARSIRAKAALHRMDLNAAREELSHIQPPRVAPYTISATLSLLEGRFDEKLIRAANSEYLTGFWVAMMSDWARAGMLQHVEKVINEKTGPFIERSTLHAVSAALFYLGAFEDAAWVAVVSFNAHNDPQDAFNVACCHARMKNTETAMVWLTRAVEDGFNHSEEIRADEDLVSLHPLPEFDALLARVSTPASTQATPA